MLSHRDSELLNYYIQLWGQPVAQQVFTHPDAVSLQPLWVFTFTDVQPPQTWIYATLGASHRAMHEPNPAIDARMELFIIANHARDELITNIGTIALYPFVHQTYIGKGHIIRGGPDGSIVDGSPLTNLLLTHADYGEQIQPYVHHDDGTHTELLWVVPISSHERQYAVKHGYQRLIELFEQQQTDVFDLHRKPIVSRLWPF